MGWKGSFSPVLSEARNGTGFTVAKGSPKEAGEMGGTLNPPVPTSPDWTLDAVGARVPLNGTAAPGQPLPGEGVAVLMRATGEGAEGEGWKMGTFDTWLGEDE